MTRNEDDLFLAEKPPEPRGKHVFKVLDHMPHDRSFGQHPHVC